jgi:hypothetical protein
MTTRTSNLLAQSVIGSDKLSVSELYKIKGQVALGEYETPSAAPIPYHLHFSYWRWNRSWSRDRDRPRSE